MTGGYLREDDDMGTTVQELAQVAWNYMESKTRPDGETYWKHIDNAPEWIVTLCRKAHDGMLPDDYRYEYITDALLTIIDSDDPEDEMPESDGRNLRNWLASHGSRVGYCDAAIEEFGAYDSTYNLLTDGQTMEIQEVYRMVLGYLNERVEELEAEEPDDEGEV